MHVIADDIFSVASITHDKVKFRTPVRPGMMLRMPVVVTAARHGVFKFKGEVYADGAKAAQAEFAAKAVEHA